MHKFVYMFAGAVLGAVVTNVINRKYVKDATDHLAQGKSIIEDMSKVLEQQQKAMEGYQKAGEEAEKSLDIARKALESVLPEYNKQRGPKLVD